MALKHEQFRKTNYPKLSNSKGITSDMKCNLALQICKKFKLEFESKELRGTQREYSSKPLKHSIVKRILVFKR